MMIEPQGYVIIGAVGANRIHGPADVVPTGAPTLLRREKRMKRPRGKSIGRLGAGPGV
jgi:hypothetical protein